MSYVAFVEHSHVLQKMLTQLCSERGVECRAIDGTVAALAMIAAEAPLAIVAGLEQKDLSAVSLVAALKCDRTLSRCKASLGQSSPAHCNCHSPTDSTPSSR